MESLKASIIFTRHGEPSKYLPKRKNPEDIDLTPTGIEQARETARQLYNTVKKYDRVVVVSSPAPRAEDTALAFIKQYNQLADSQSKLDELRQRDAQSGSTNVEVGNNTQSKLSKLNLKRKASSVRPMDIKDLPAFLKYMDDESTPIYGQLWLTDEYLATDNPVVESREKVDARANKFLMRYTDFILKQTVKAKEKKGSICILVFSHFEVGTNILKALYTDQSQFPIAKLEPREDGEQVYVADKESQNYAEPIIIEPSLISKDGVEEKVYNITAPSCGGLTRTVKLIKSENRFIPVGL